MFQFSVKTITTFALFERFSGTNEKGLQPLIKGCVCYIFASLFCKSKREHF